MSPKKRSVASRNRLNASQLRHVLRPRSFARYFLVGVVNTGLGLCVFPVFFWSFSKSLNINTLIVLSWALCAGFSFISHKYVTFRSSGNKHREGVKFIVLSLFILGISLIVLNAAMRFFNTNPVWTQVLLNLVISLSLAVVSYFGLDRFIFPAVNKSAPTKNLRP